MNTVLTVCSAGLVVTLLSGAASRADDNESAAPLLVGVKSAPPFVMINESSDHVSGFSIDLIRLVGAQMHPPRRVEFQVHHTIDEHLDAVRSGEVALGIAATSFTSERQRTLDFSVPFYQSGLDIAVRPEGDGTPLWEILTSRKLIRAFIMFTVFIVVCAHVVWLTERGESNTFDDSWMAGVGQATWWTIVTMTTVGYGDFVPRKPLSRLLSVLVILAGIVLFGVVVGAVSSALTVQNLTSDIQHPDDLREQTVAVVQETLADRVMSRRGADVLRVPGLDEALLAVESGEAAAAVHDFPLLRHSLSQDSRGLLLVGRLFSIRGYGITYPMGSDLRKEINVALLELTEGEPSPYRQLRERWFGVE